MNKIILLVLSILCIALLVFFGTQFFSKKTEQESATTQQESAKVSQDVAHYENAKFGFGFSYPSSWENINVTTINGWESVTPVDETGNNRYLLSATIDGEAVVFATVHDYNYQSGTHNAIGQPNVYACTSDRADLVNDFDIPYYVKNITSEISSPAVERKVWTLCFNTSKTALALSVSPDDTEEFKGQIETLLNAVYTLEEKAVKTNEISNSMPGTDVVELSVIDNVLTIEQIGISMIVPDRFTDFKLTINTDYDDDTHELKVKTLENQHNVVTFKDSYTDKSYRFGISGEGYLPETDCGLFICNDIKRFDAYCKESKECYQEYYETPSGFEVQKQIIGSGEKPQMGGWSPDNTYWRIDLNLPSVRPLVFYHPDISDVQLSKTFEEIIDTIQLIQ